MLSRDALVFDPILLQSLGRFLGKVFAQAIESGWALSFCSSFHDRQMVGENDSYRAWLDELGPPITVQQRAMRHGDIRVTMKYGDAVED